MLLLVPSLLTVGEVAGLGSSLDSIWAEFMPLGILPFALSLGVLRHEVLGFRTIVRRTALYAGVTVVAAALYVAVVAVFAAMIDNGVGAGPVVATGPVAISLQPVRVGVQRLLDRWVFGDRDEPYRALAGLGHRLGGGDADPPAVVAEVVRSSLRLDAVSIEWEHAASGEHVVAARAGNVRSTGSERVPIVFGSSPPAVPPRGAGARNPSSTNPAPSTGPDAHAHTPQASPQDGQAPAAATTPATPAHRQHQQTSSHPIS